MPWPTTIFPPVGKVKALHDENNNKIYYEDSDHNWEKYEYDENNNLIERECSDGSWWKNKYDKNNNLIKRHLFLLK
jgi:YD repeat-containing protein